nr:serine protease 7 isoform X3 [Drosophila simulans]
MVSVMISRKAECGGSLITARYVLTAAHCISPKYMNVRLGEYDTRHPMSDCNDSGCRPRAYNVDVDKKIVHSNLEYDIGLLRMQRLCQADLPDCWQNVWSHFTLQYHRMGYK